MPKTPLFLANFSIFWKDLCAVATFFIIEGANKIKLTNYSTKRGVAGAPLRTVKDRFEITELAGIQEKGQEEDEGEVNGDSWQ